MPTDLREIHQIGADTREVLVSPEHCPALCEGRIRLCGISQARPGFRFERLCPGMAQLMAVVHGHGGCLLDGTWRRLEAGEAYATPAGVPHAYAADDPQGVWTLCWAHLDEPDGASRLLDSDRPQVLALDARPLHDAILNLHRECLGVGASPLASQWARLVIGLVQRALAPVADDLQIGRLWEEVDADLARPWTLGDLAHLAGCRPEQLRRRCQAGLGRSPMAHLGLLRMRRAESLLAVGGRSVAQVAGEVGYGDPFAFSTAFRRISGRPPSALLPGR